MDIEKYFYFYFFENRIFIIEIYVSHKRIRWFNRGFFSAQPAASGSVLWAHFTDFPRGILLLLLQQSLFVKHRAFRFLNNFDLFLFDFFYYYFVFCFFFWMIGTITTTGSVVHLVGVAAHITPCVYMYIRVRLL